MSWEPSLWEVTDSFVFLTYASLAASRTLLQWLLAFLNFSLESDDFSFWYNLLLISMNYGCSTSSWKPWRWVRFDLIFSMMDIYINSNLNPRTKFTSSSRGTGFKEKLFPVFVKTFSNSHKIYKMKETLWWKRKRYKTLTLNIWRMERTFGFK